MSPVFDTGQVEELGLYYWGSQLAAYPGSGYPAQFSTVNDYHEFASLSAASSTYEERATAAQACTNLNGASCSIVTMWKGAASGSQWLQCLNPGATVSRPAIAYDQRRDRFVVFLVGLDGRMWYRDWPAWTHCTYGGFSPMESDLPVGRRWRYMGGFVFDHIGSAAADGGTGSLFAASADNSVASIPHSIREVRFRFDLASGHYRLISDSSLGASVSVQLAETSRPFGVTRLRHDDTTVLAWWSTDAAPVIRFTRRMNLSQPFSAPTTLSSPGPLAATSVSLAPVASSERLVWFATGARP